MRRVLERPFCFICLYDGQDNDVVVCEECCKGHFASNIFTMGRTMMWLYANSAWKAILLQMSIWWTGQWRGCMRRVLERPCCFECLDTQCNGKDHTQDSGNTCESYAGKLSKKLRRYKSNARRTDWQVVITSIIEFNSNDKLFIFKMYDPHLILESHPFIYDHDSYPLPHQTWTSSY